MKKVVIFFNKILFNCIKHNLHTSDQTKCYLNYTEGIFLLVRFFILYFLFIFSKFSGLLKWISGLPENQDHNVSNLGILTVTTTMY